MDDRARRMPGFVLLVGLALRLVLPILSGPDAPRLLEVRPAPDSSDVLPRSQIVFNFDRPMNRDATRNALLIKPQTAGDLVWDDDARVLTFQPSNTLVPNVTYTVEFTAGALGRWWRPLEAVAPIRFRTADIPTVLGAYPAERAADANGAIALVFSQPMVPNERIGQPTTVEALTFDPPFARTDIWASANTLIVQPQQRLAPATRYRGMLDASLTDARGADLGKPFSWSFTTAWPRLLNTAPADGDRYVAPRRPLTFTLDQPLDLTQLQASLNISPTVERDITTLTLPDNTQLVTVTPRLGWDVGRFYRISFRPLDGSLPSDFSFTVAARPAPCRALPRPKPAARGRSADSSALQHTNGRGCGARWLERRATRRRSNRHRQRDRGAPGGRTTSFHHIHLHTCRCDGRSQRRATQ
ncbi:Ig-like domain-containing protein [Candidatus Gracilibacteria bacterium]|nr:Ig-like domain-containing protein [Candidatus Gracilibacteria bacterium]